MSIIAISDASLDSNTRTHAASKTRMWACPWRFDEILLERSSLLRQSDRVVLYVATLASKDSGEFDEETERETEFAPIELG